MAAHRQLDGIRDHFAADQRGLHALVSHRDAVGDRDGAEFARRAAAVLDAFLAACAWRISAMLQGADSFQHVATPTKGRWISSSVRPIA